VAESRHSAHSAPCRADGRRPLSAGRAAVAALLAAATLGGCAELSPGVGVNSVVGYEGLGREIRRFYDRRAQERFANCPGAEMERILSARVVDETEDEIVARVRYAWRDENRLGNGDGRLVPGGGGSCRGIDERRFTLEKFDGDVAVVAMSGPRRARPLPR
jgi:hypothetical protein